MYTSISIYVNKRNPHKFIEVHQSKCSHYTIRQFMEFENGIKNYTGDKLLHRISVTTLNDILKDYKPYRTEFTFF